jgi:aspartyl-tRNA(Asn)/glutamyl-tRNA(Gln) amidotransferase subunit A
LNDVDPDVLAAFSKTVETLSSLGVEVVETETPSAEDYRLATSLGLIVSRSEAAAYHQSFSNARSQYTRPVFEQLDEASKVKAMDYINAQRFRSEFQERMLAHLSGFDALIMPTTKVAAPKLEDADAYLIILSTNCIPWSFIGVPAISVPSGFTPDGLPVGAQMVASPFDDGILLALASALESQT